ncbi:MAG: aminotransferase class V-fold PLP-dependent enzyme [Candidatus Latescibacteria bacterium]|nr:aminotransferase class V-fold PLP-dependent enzyme [Candidatus Latescibacterota bacterium]
MERRTFFKGFAAALAAAPALPQIAAALSDYLQALKADLAVAGAAAAYWQRVKEEFLLEPGLLHFNCGSIGAVPRPVVETLKAYIDRLETNPYNYVWEGFPDAKIIELVNKAKGFLNGWNGDILFTRNTTEGMNLVATGLQLKAGDEILTTDHEHPGGIYGWLHLAQQQGVRVRQLHLPTPVTSKAQILQLVEDSITPQTRVCSFSHVNTTTGLLMPLADIAALTAPKGILLVCDGAQAPGMLDVSVTALKVDAYASSSHKWMLAPKGCGLLYVRKAVQDRIRPISAFAENGGSQYGPYTGATGTRNVPQLLAHGDAMDFHTLFGKPRVEARLRQLCTYLRQRLVAIPHLVPLTPEVPELSSAMVAYRVQGSTPTYIYGELAKRRIIVKHASFNWVLPGNTDLPRETVETLRFSTHLFNDEAQIDQLVEAIAEILGVKTAVGMEIQTEPAASTLEANYPNPFNASTRIEYELSRAEQVQVAVYDAQGQLIETLKQGFQEAGRHQLTWDAGRRATGTYFYQVKTSGVQQTRKMLLLR